jgi:hypothetical protein
MSTKSSQHNQSNRIDQSLNSLEVLQVCVDLASKRIEHYSLYKGLNCIWASYGTVNAYYLFKDCQIVRIEYD